MGVQGIERWILARLRHHQFFSVAEINIAIKPLLEEYNKKAFQKLPGSRVEQFNNLDKPALKPLPKNGYEYAEWRQAKVNIDYHVAFEKHYYSVPYTYLGKKITLRITVSTIEFFYQDQRIASHRRSYKSGFTSVKEHMPEKHQKHLEWNSERIVRWASSVGTQTKKLIEMVIESKVVEQQSYRSCLGILRLSKSYGETRLENAAKRAIAMGCTRYHSIESILKKGLDRQPLPVAIQKSAVPNLHENIRGADYYH